MYTVFFIYGNNLKGGLKMSIWIFYIILELTGVCIILFMTTADRIKIITYIYLKIHYVIKELSRCITIDIYRRFFKHDYG